MGDLLIPLNIIIPIAVVVIILVILMRILYSKNKKLKSVLDSEKKKFDLYKKEISNIKAGSDSPKQDFESLNKLVRNFFKEYFGLEYHLTYLELESRFKKLNKPLYSEFCKAMSDADYSGAKNKKSVIKGLINKFSEILSSYSD